MTWRVPVGALMLGVLFNLLRALEVASFRAAPPDELFASTTIMQVLGALSIMVATIIADEAVARGARRWHAYSMAVAAGAALASLAQFHVRASLGLRIDVGHASLPQEIAMLQALAFFFELCIWGGIGVFLYVSYRRAHEAATHFHATEIQRSFARRRAFETRLKVLQAHVEPQFLLDILVQVRDLYDRNPEAGGVMLDALITYLRAALPQVRVSTSTLGREYDLANAYTRIVRLRCPAGLDVDFEIPAALRPSPMPPMLLLPLCAVLVRSPVPDPRRRSLRVTAMQRGGTLMLVAEMDGREDLSPADRESIAGLQERLRILHGAKACLDVDRHGVDSWRATLRSPLETNDGDHR